MKNLERVWIKEIGVIEEDGCEEIYTKKKKLIEKIFELNDLSVLNVDILIKNNLRFIFIVMKIQCI